MTTQLVAVRRPNAAEKKKGAEVVFERTSENGTEHVILACACYESWEQWGAETSVLGDNVNAVEMWRRNGFGALEGE